MQLLGCGAVPTADLRLNQFGGRVHLALNAPPPTPEAAPEAPSTVFERGAAIEEGVEWPTYSPEGAPERYRPIEAKYSATRGLRRPEETANAITWLRSDTAGFVNQWMAGTLPVCTDTGRPRQWPRACYLPGGRNFAATAPAPFIASVI